MEVKNIAKRKTKVLYWIVTLLLALGMSAGGVAQIIRAQPNVEGMIILGYPTYVMSILGVWKILGVATLLIPKYPLLKEWAYAGFFFAMSGATISHWVMEDDFSRSVAPLIFMIFTVLSWWLRPQSRKLPCLAEALGRNDNR